VNSIVINNDSGNVVSLAQLHDRSTELVKQKS